MKGIMHEDGRIGRLLAVALPVLAAVVAGCGEDEPAQVLDVMEQARDAVVDVVDGDRATVVLDVERYVAIEVVLVKTDDDWRIDDSEAVPVGEN